MFEVLCAKLGTFLLHNSGFTVSVIAAMLWLTRKKPGMVSVAGMEHDPLESDSYLDTVAALRSLGVAKAAAKKRAEAVMLSNPDVTDPQELLKLCYQEGGDG